MTFIFESFLKPSWQVLFTADLKSFSTHGLTTSTPMKRKSASNALTREATTKDQSDHTHAKPEVSARDMEANTIHDESSLVDRVKRRKRMAK
jgi:hypothetical protein